MGIIEQIQAMDKMTVLYVFGALTAVAIVIIGITRVMAYRAIKRHWRRMERKK